MGEAQGLRHRIARGGRAFAGCLLTLALAASAPGQVAGSAPARPETARPRGFQSILWLHGGPTRDAKFFRAVKAAGFSAVSVSADQDPAVPGRHGLGYYQDQICGKGVLELRDAQFRPVREDYVRTREDTTLLRPSCLAESATLVRLIEIVGKRLARTLPHRPWSISLGDEISVTRHANPLDFCFAPASLVAFRKFVTARYRTIDRLNERWGTDFASFARVRPFTADAIRRREFGSRGLPVRLTPWADHREFMDRELARVVRAVVRQIERRAPAVPAGLTGLQQPSAYGGHDYARLLPLCRFYEAYDIGAARDLAMSFAPPGADQVATLFAPKGPVSDALVQGQYADLIAHGMSGAVVWSAGLCFAADSTLKPYGRALQRAMAELRGAADAFAGATLRRSSVWLVESQASVRAWWMLDSRRDGATWIQRLSSHEATHSTSLAARHGWVRLLEDLGLQPQFVAAETLTTRLANAPPKVLVLPATIAMSDADARAIRNFVEAGGVLLADHAPGLYDERLVLRQVPVLDELFAVRRRPAHGLLIREGRVASTGRLPSGAAAGERGLTAEVSDPAGAFHVQLENTVGRGRTCYLNMAVCEYGGVRLVPARVDVALDLRRRIRSVLRGAGVLPPVFLRAKARMPTCLERMVLRGRDGRRLLAIRLNALESPALWLEIAKRGVVPLEVTFPETVRLRDLVTGADHPAKARHMLDFDPVRGLFLHVQKAE